MCVDYGGMKDRFRTFCREYVKNGGKPVPAAVAAGYSAKSAASQASRLLKNPKIRAEIDRLVASIGPECLVDHKFVLSNLKEVAVRCMQKVPVMEFDREEMQYKQKEQVTEDGKVVGVWEFNANGANKALELMGRHLKMFTDKVEVKDTTDRAAAIAKARRRAGKAEPSEDPQP